MAADPLSLAFSALADPTRRDIVARLAIADATVNELAAPYDVSVQAVSKHLRVLEQAGLVSRSRQAQRRPVHLEAQVFDLMTAWIERYRRQAEERYRRLEAVLAELPDDVAPLPPTAEHPTNEHPTAEHPAVTPAGSSTSSVSSTPRPTRCSGPTPTPTSSPAGSARAG